jgi:hypothetical protein
MTMPTPSAAQSSDTRHEERGGVTPSPDLSITTASKTGRAPSNDDALETSLATGLVLTSSSANVELPGHFAQHLTPQPQVLQFDPQRRAASEGLRAAVASITTLLKQREADLMPRKRGRQAATEKRWLLAIEALVCNLACLRTRGPDSRLSVPRSNAMSYAGIWVTA